MESAHKNWTSPTFGPRHIVHYHAQRYVPKFSSILSYACAIPPLVQSKNSGYHFVSTGEQPGPRASIPATMYPQKQPTKFNIKTGLKNGHNYAAHPVAHKPMHLYLKFLHR